MEPESLNQTRNRPVANLTASLPLDIFHQLGYAVDVVKTQSDMQSLTRTSAGARLVLNVKNAYYGLLRAYGRRDVSQAAVTYAQAQVADAVAKHDNGIVPLFDVTTAQVNLSNLDQQLIAAQSQIGIAQAALDRVLGIDPNTPVEVAQASVPVSLTAVDVVKGVEEAFARRPEVQAAQAAVNLARTNVKLQKAGSYPAVSLTAGGNYLFDSPVPGFDGLTWQVGASVSLPVADGGAVAAKVRQAGSDLQSSMDALDQAKLTVAQDVRTAALSLQEAAQRTRVTAGTVALAETALGLAKDRYEAGMGILTEVTNAQAQLIQAQFNAVNAQYDYAIALAQLQWATFAQPELAQLLSASGSQPEKP
jgi:outer membrane protein TolC